MQNAYRVHRRGRGERPLIERPGIAAVDRGGMQQCLDRGPCLSFPEPAGLDIAEPAGCGEACCADHRGERVDAAAHGRPAHPRGQAWRELLRIEHRDWPDRFSRLERDREVVGPGRGRDDCAGRIQDRVHHEMQALARARRADHEHAVLYGCPHLLPARTPEVVADIRRLRGLGSE